MTKVYQAIASALDAMRRCECDHGKPGMGHLYEWIDRHREGAEELTSTHMPSGSGIDDGTTLCVDRCTDDELVFTTSYHHMDEFGGYDGWTDHDVVVRPSFLYEIEVGVTGEDRNEVNDYLADVFLEALSSEIEG